MTALEIVSGSPLAGASTSVLETERLVLRAPRLEDVKAIAALANNRKIAEMTSTIPHPYAHADAEAWVGNAMAQAGAHFAVFTKDDEFVGACGYREVAGCAVGEAAPELGYWIGEPYWNRGYATEAVRAVIDHAFADNGLEVLHGGCRVTNLASRRVLEKCGFQWTGAGLCRVRALSASVPIDRFRLDRRTWESLRAWGTRALPKRGRAVRKHAR
jgi:RimJ/RimL family protein N-acetyltransferase